jgi:hypothetical protein
MCEIYAYLLEWPSDSGGVGPNGNQAATQCRLHLKLKKDPTLKQEPIEGSATVTVSGFKG